MGKIIGLISNSYKDIGKIHQGYENCDSIEITIEKPMGKDGDYDISGEGNVKFINCKKGGFLPRAKNSFVSFSMNSGNTVTTLNGVNLKYTNKLDFVETASVTKVETNGDNVDITIQGQLALYKY